MSDLFRAGGALDDVRARAALTRLAEPGDVEMTRWVEQLGAVEVLARVVDGSLGSRRLTQYQARLGGRDVELDQIRLRQLGLRLIVPGASEWPGQLDDLGEARPLALWARGEGDLGALGLRAVSVVGARACTAYGEHVAGSMGAGLAGRGWTVVSGAAYGVDAAAHRGALAVEGHTVAVVAGGVDVVYPAAHDTLLERVRQCGLVISELPPGARPTRHRFLKRNRLIAALGRGTVVVEAALRSGQRTLRVKLGSSSELSWLSQDLSLPRCPPGATS
jgi:DNA processing protein